MEPRRPAAILLTVLAYIVATFGVQGTSHFAVNKTHYAQVTYMRAEPIVAMGITAMVIQGVIFALLFPAFNRAGNPIRNGVLFALAIGVFLASYIALAEAGKYAVPSIPSWIVVESGTALVQFGVFGVLLGLIHRPRSAS